MISTNLLKTMRQIASSDETRIAINGIRVEPEGLLIATDGRRMGILENEDIDASEAFTIPSRFVESLPSNSKAFLFVKDGRIQATINDINYSCAPIDVEFPTAWRTVVPSPWPKTFDLRRLAANIGWLNQICEIADQLGEGPGYVVTSGRDEGDVICIKSKRFTGLLMPIRAEEAYEEPRWIK